MVFATENELYIAWKSNKTTEHGIEEKGGEKGETGKRISENLNVTFARQLFYAISDFGIRMLYFLIV